MKPGSTAQDTDSGSSSVGPTPLPQALRRLRVRDLELLRGLATTRSFSQTAEAAAMTQPALSKWLRELERTLGAVLFRRTTRQVAATPYGEALVACANRMMADLAAVPQAFDALRQGTGVPVSIGLLPGIAPLLIPRVLSALPASGVALTLRVYEDTVDRLLPMAQRHELDLLVCRLDAIALRSGLAWQALYEDVPQVFCGVDHPLAAQQAVAWAQTATEPWISGPASSPIRLALEDEFARAGLPMPAVVHESVSLATNIAMARSTRCLFVASRRNVAGSPAAAGVCALPLQLNALALPVGMLWTAPSRPPVEVLRALLAQIAAAGLPG